MSSDFTKGNIMKSLLGFMAPVLGALFLQAMYGAVDLLVEVFHQQFHYQTIQLSMHVIKLL